MNHRMVFCRYVLNAERPGSVAGSGHHLANLYPYWILQNPEIVDRQWASPCQCILSRYKQRGVWQKRAFTIHIFSSPFPPRTSDRLQGGRTGAANGLKGTVDIIFVWSIPLFEITGVGDPVAMRYICSQSSIMPITSCHPSH